MNQSIRNPYKLLAPAVLALLVAGCYPPLTKPEGAVDARSSLTLLQTDAQLASRAPVAIMEAEQAVSAAEVPNSDPVLTRHLVVMAERKVDIARNQAQTRLLEDQRKTLGEQREAARLDARTREADRARNEASSARSDASAARTDAEIARADADTARGQADTAVIAAEAATIATETARQQNSDLKKQLAELNARSTDRGMVVTLGDVLFDTGKSRLKGGDPSHLGKLAGFLKRYPTRTAVIEGHTDNVGSEGFNIGLSKRRADSVKAYLIAHGVSAHRLVATGMGEISPVSENGTASGRQLNRRVEVIIANTITASR